MIKEGTYCIVLLDGEDLSTVAFIKHIGDKYKVVE